METLMFCSLCVMYIICNLDFEQSNVISPILILIRSVPELKSRIKLIKNYESEILTQNKYTLDVNLPPSSSCPGILNPKTIGRTTNSALGRKRRNRMVVTGREGEGWETRLE